MRLRPAVSAFLALFATPLLAHLAAPSLAHAESFTYDSQNRLVRIDNGLSTTTLQYDAFGNLVRSCRDATCQDLVVDDASGDSVAFVSPSGDASLLSRGPLGTAAIRLPDDSVGFPLHDDSLAPRGLAVLSKPNVDSNGVGGSVSRFLSVHRVARDPYGAYRASDLPAPFAQHGAFQALSLDDDGSFLLGSSAFSTEDATSLQRRPSEGSPFAALNRYALAAHNPLASPVAFGTPGASGTPYNPHLDGNIDPNLAAASVGLSYDRSAALTAISDPHQIAAFGAEMFQAAGTILDLLDLLPTAAFLPSSARTNVQSHLANRKGGHSRFDRKLDFDGTELDDGSLIGFPTFEEAILDINRNHPADALYSAASRLHTRDNNCFGCALATDATLAFRPAVALPMHGPGHTPYITSQIDDLHQAFGYRPKPATLERMRTILQTPNTRMIIGARMKSGGGHWFNAYNRNGNIFVVDGQSGVHTLWDGAPGQRYLDQVKPGWGLDYTMAWPPPPPPARF